MPSGASSPDKATHGGTDSGKGTDYESDVYPVKCETEAAEVTNMRRAVCKTIAFKKKRSDKEPELSIS